MTPQSLANQIEGLVIAANERYARQIITVQSKLYNDLVTILKFIDTDADGNIIQNAGNRAILRAGQQQFDKTIQNSGYQDAVETHLKVIPKIDDLNAAYFESVSSAFLPNRVFIRQLQSSAIETVNSYVLQDGLQSQVALPLNQILSQNINSGGSFSGMLKQLEIFAKGNQQVEGRLLSYTRTYISDVIFNYSRAYQQSVTADLKLEWYSYSGGIQDKTRPFCEARAGKFFPHKEVESWASLDWQGKNSLTTSSSIFIFCGGWNCRHSLIPVHESIVPTEDTDRARSEGYIS